MAPSCTIRKTEHEYNYMFNIIHLVSQLCAGNFPVKDKKKKIRKNVKGVRIQYHACR